MSSSKVALGRLDSCTFKQAVELRNRGFEGYFTPSHVTMDRLLTNFVKNRIRPECSVVAFMNGKPVGFVFLAFQTEDGMKLAWNGGTGVFPEYRGMGIAKSMMQEAHLVIREQAVDQAILEVRTDNPHAISAYRKSGFQVVDRLIGLEHSGKLNKPFFADDLPMGMCMKYGAPSEIGDLSFYRNQVAWGSRWQHIRDGESVCLLDAADSVAGYALFKRSYDSNGQLESVALYQCEVSTGQSDREVCFRILLEEVFGPFDQPCKRITGNLSMANPEPVTILKEVGLTTKYEQYLMIARLDSKRNK